MCHRKLIALLMPVVGFFAGFGVRHLLVNQTKITVDAPAPKKEIPDISQQFQTVTEIVDEIQANAEQNKIKVRFKWPE